MKAQKLLKNITDRKERTDPSIPPALGGPLPKLNGLVNGYSHHCSSSIKSGTSVIRLPPKQRQDIPFSDTPAIVRTPAGMSTFLQLDQDLNRNRVSAKAAPSADSDDQDLARRLKELAIPAEDGIDCDDVDSPGSIQSVGEKRKL
jgi:transcriptional activator SPT7